MKAPSKSALIGLHKEVAHHPGFAVCYGRGPIKREGKLFRVHKGKRTLVSRTLCVAKHYGRRCTVCPNSTFIVTLGSPDEV